MISIACRPTASTRVQHPAPRRGHDQPPVPRKGEKIALRGALREQFPRRRVEGKAHHRGGGGIGIAPLRSIYGHVVRHPRTTPDWTYSTGPRFGFHNLQAGVPRPSGEEEGGRPFVHRPARARMEPLRRLRGRQPDQGGAISQRTPLPSPAARPSTSRSRSTSSRSSGSPRTGVHHSRAQDEVRVRQVRPLQHRRGLHLHEGAGVLACAAPEAPAGGAAGQMMNGECGQYGNDGQYGRRAIDGQSRAIWGRRSFPSPNCPFRRYSRLPGLPVRPALPRLPVL